MTVGECIRRVDRLRPNTADENEKVRWIWELEQELRRDFLPRYQSLCPGFRPDYGPVVRPEGPPSEAGPVSRSEPLVAGGPFESLYLYHLLAQLERTDQEWESCDAYQALANQALSEFKKAWNRTHLPGRVAVLRL